jgi:hypothetical protein
MGEYSKRIGEIGEEFVSDFLKTIGWLNPMLNFDIPSVDPDKHGKKNNGIDGFFHYRNPMIANTIENVIFSVKFSTKKYPANPIKVFKEYYTDLAMAIESFKYSDIRNNSLSQHSHIESTFERGILFWINNIKDETDMTSKLSGIKIPKGYNHDGIILVDNNKMGFIFDSITYVNNKYSSNHDVRFSYFITGMNNDDQNIRQGKILPVQYLSSSILPFRVQNQLTDEVTLVICTSDNFDEDGLVKLMGLAKNIGNNMQTKTVIAFPDYNKTDHEQRVDLIKQSFNDNFAFIQGLTIESFNTGIIR